ncbi:MAG: DUF4179 domain-containing protein [Aminipila sp.]
MKKIDDMMQNYKLVDFNVSKIKPMSNEGGIKSMSGEEKNAILQQTLKKVNQDGKAYTPRKKRFILLAAALITIFALAVFSFASTNLNMNFLNFFNPKSNTETNMLNSLGTIIDKKVTQNGITIHVKEALGDRNSIYVLFDIISDDNTILSDKYYTFAEELVSIQSKSSFVHGIGYFFEQLEDDNTSDNKISMVLCLSSSEKLIGKNMTLRFTDFSTYNTFTDNGHNTNSSSDIYNLVASGSWEITFPIDYQDNTLVYRVNKKVIYEDAPLKIKTVRISPVSLSMTLSNLTLSRVNMSNVAITIYMKNGEAIDSTRSSGIHSNGFRIVFDTQFNEVIDPKEIDYIEFSGEKIQI